MVVNGGIGRGALNGFAEVIFGRFVLTELQINPAK
jgi:hypothetical protein